VACPEFSQEGAEGQWGEGFFVPDQKIGTKSTIRKAKDTK
jgi:hypothetical protein